ncbi:peptidoglycan-associated lipoprotein Pal [Agaribacter marinus]|uniref:Peptidoglycan-associated lipoprotein n=1 Tax=Agaribacter marinus TaxID=1431249 RepID=A0AA37T1B1_9ALTE|nr:peptidoglycan-associated lipoprotein Pal [Agaribacter marinus]GLR72069.1 peptidoglycan-associated lipoprotein [Agaribacter marinus]
MLTNNKLKSLLIVLPTLTLMACANSDGEEQSADTNAAAEAAAAADAAKKAEEAEKARAEAAAADKLRKAKDLMAKEKAALEAQQTVYFDFDRSTIKAEFQSVLKKHADFLVKNSSQKIVIEGHTDSRGTPDYNIALGERRAKAVETFFLNAGVRSSQMSVVSYGEEKPAVMGASEYAFAQNRRGVVVYQ